MSKVRSVSPGRSLEVNALLTGQAWDGPVTFGFVGGVPPGTGVSAAGAQTPDAVLKDAVRKALALVADFADITICESRDGSGADIRVVEADWLSLDRQGESITLGGYAFAPGGDTLAGDIFLGADIGSDVSAGSYGFRTVLHEVGHALGLTHPDEAGRFGALPASIDGPELTVMSARSAPGLPPHEGIGAEPGGHAEGFMPADIAALQHLYGASYGGTGTRYVFDPAERVMLRTIWDGGGRDVYDFRAYTNDLAIDLAPGGHSTTGQEPQLNRAQEIGRGDAPIYAEGAIHNAYLHKGDMRSLIENAIAGAGDDTVRGNGTYNRLEGRGGDDRLFGEGRADRLFGGEGDDWLSGGRGFDMLHGGRGADVLCGNGGGDTIRGGIGGDRADGGDGHDDIALSHANDSLWGGHGNDTLDGERGADLLRGGLHDDRLLGGLGNDELFGGAGHDTLAGGRSAQAGDTLTGGPGADRFLVVDTARIRDFDGAEGDRLDVPHPREAFRRLSADGSDVEVPLAGTDATVRLVDVAVADLSPDHFV